MKIATALLAANLLLAGCSGSSDGPAPDPTTSPDASRPLDQDQLDEATKKQAEQQKVAQDQLSAEVDKQAAGVVNVRIKDGKVTPQGKRVEVDAGQQITLNITSDADEEIHVHSDPEHTYKVTAGTPVTESFTIDTPGQVAVEAHELGVTIVQLVVGS